MAETDLTKFNLKYFFTGSGLKDWFKSWGFGWRLIVTIILLFLLVSGIKSLFFSKTQTQTQKMNVYPFSFSTITYAPQQEQKQEIKKRPWWLPIFFVEGYGFSETAGIGNSRTGIGIKAGGRFEL